MNARTTAIARAALSARAAERRARVVRACRDTARTVRSLARRLGVCERTIRRDIAALGPVLERRGERFRAVDTGLTEAQFSAACDAALGGEMDWGTG